MKVKTTRSTSGLATPYKGRDCNLIKEILLYYIFITLIIKFTTENCKYYINTCIPILYVIDYCSLYCFYIKKAAYKGTLFILFSNPKFLVDNLIAYFGLNIFI